METISSRIQEALNAKDMKQSDLVRLTGIGKSSISTYISGDYEPKQRNIYKIAKALNVSEFWLMGNDVPMERAKDPPTPTSCPTTRPGKSPYSATWPPGFRYSRKRT